jgi:aminodeoxyfutalosine deaminase
MAYLAENRIALEVCPTSNVRTRAVASLDEHPLPTLVGAGVPVSINSDDPPMFGTTLEEEYAVAARLLDLDERGGRTGPGGRHAELPRPGRQGRLLAEIDAYAARTAARAARRAVPARSPAPRGCRRSGPRSSARAGAC